MSDRHAASEVFLANAGWQHAQRSFLAGDASDRSYDRLVLPTGTAVLMDAPPGKGDDPATFIQIATHLSGIGLSPPTILAQDLENGFLLIEDLGDGVFARLAKQTPDLEAVLYESATDVLVHLHQHPAAPNLGNLSAREWADAACFALDWYRFAITQDRIDTTVFRDTLSDLITTHADGPRVMILRDYHAENLLWLPDRIGIARVGLLDFQLAQLGQPAYDLVSLLQDARRDVSPALAARIKARFVTARQANPEVFETHYAVLGAQRALRILGIFARLCLVAGKDGYLSLLPRVWQQLQTNLAHPELAALKALCDTVLPAPTPANLSKIGSQCGQFR